MAVEIQKQVKITISGEDVEVLKSICDLARRFSDLQGFRADGKRGMCEFDASQMVDIGRVMMDVFKA